MATFITTIKFTPQGLAQVKDTARRAAAFKASAKKLGCKVVATYWTLGHFDGVSIFEAPDDETAAALMVQLAAQGFVYTQTARAFEAGEIEEVLKKLTS